MSSTKLGLFSASYRKSENRLSLGVIYNSYQRYCRSLDIEPLDFDTWRDTRDKLGDFHDNPSSILAYKRG